MPTYNVFHISGSPPSWICDDVTVIHPVIDFHGRNIILNFHVDLFVSFRSSVTHVRLTDDRHIDRHRHRLKPPTWGGQWVNNVASSWPSDTAYCIIGEQLNCHPGFLLGNINICYTQSFEQYAAPVLNNN